MLFRRHNIHEYAAGPQHPVELLNGQGGKAVEQQVHGAVRHRQMVRRGHGKFNVLFPLGCPAQDELGYVRPCHLRGLAGLLQGAIDTAGVVSFTAPGIQHRRGLSGHGNGQGAQCLPQGSVITLS